MDKDQILLEQAYESIHNSVMLPNFTQLSIKQFQQIWAQNYGDKPNIEAFQWISWSSESHSHAYLFIVEDKEGEDRYILSHAFISMNEEGNFDLEFSGTPVMEGNDLDAIVARYRSELQNHI